ncbi:DUF397 domain-containing protein [Lentzea atacamensis]|uniref:DUF397 domain-containing protein n=1 Tax=Lentzea atacamensis TaxID=531938 RepID=UPI000D6AA24C
MAGEAGDGCDVSVAGEGGGRGVGIRDSKAPTTHLPVSASAWSAFLTEVKAGR